MSNQKLGRNGNGGGGGLKPGRIGPNSICPLPLIGWRPSRITQPDGADAPPLVNCLGGACAWYVLLEAPNAAQPQGRGVCAPSAMAVVISNLPSALVQLGAAAAGAPIEPLGDAPVIDTPEASGEPAAAPEA